MIPVFKNHVPSPNGSFTADFAKWKQWRFDQRLWNAIVATIPIGDSVIDLGAGTGAIVSALRARGNPSFGVDGIDGIESISGGLVRQADLTRLIPRTKPADWVLCIEVGEHVPAHLEKQLFGNIARLCTKGAFVTWAVPGQRGLGHVNFRTPEYIAWHLAARGLPTDFTATAKARRTARGNWRKKILVLRKAVFA